MIEGEDLLSTNSPIHFRRNLILARIDIINTPPIQPRNITNRNPFHLPIARRHQIRRRTPPHREHLPIPHQMARMSVARGLSLVDARPGERGQGENVDLVVDMVAVFAAVDVDVVAGVVLGGGG